MKRSVAIITARGGSKRIPRKNIKEFCGKPIIAYSIEAALESKVFDEVMVSTDDEEIAKISREYGAEIPFMRSKKNSGDFASTPDAVIEVLDNYAQQNRFFDIACCIYPTAPFITAQKLQKGIELLNDTYSVIPVVKYSFPPFRSVVIENGKLRANWEEYINCRSQDLPELYHDCGQFYYLQVEHFLRTKQLITSNTKAIEMTEIEVQDIDNEQDWQLAELKYRFINKGCLY